MLVFQLIDRLCITNFYSSIDSLFFLVLSVTMTVFKDSIYGVGEVSLMPIFHKRIRRHTESYIINKRNGTQATSIRCGTQFPLEISVPYCLCKLI